MQRKFPMIIIVLALLLSFFTFVSAENATGVISFEEYYSTLQDEYAKYGITFSIENSNLDAIYTQELLAQQLEEARFFCETLDITIAPTQTHIPPKTSPASMIMPYYFDSGSVVIKSGETIPKGYYEFEVFCSGDHDIQNSHPISATGTLRELSTFNVAESDLTLDVEITVHDQVSIWVDGTIKFSWKGPASDTYTATVYGPFYCKSFTPDDYILT